VGLFVFHLTFFNVALASSSSDPAGRLVQDAKLLQGQQTDRQNYFSLIPAVFLSSMDEFFLGPR
jgi:hypothetical protein